MSHKVSITWYFGITFSYQGLQTRKYDHNQKKNSVMKESPDQGDIIIFHIYAPKNRLQKYTKQKLTELKEKIISGF